MTRYWNDRPLGVKLATLVAAGALVLAVFALITVQALRATGERAGSLLASNEATGLALEADMMRYAVRADVLQALLSGGAGDQYQSAVTDLQQHTQKLQNILNEIAAAHLSDEVDASVEAVRPDVEAYLDGAKQEIALIAADKRAATAGFTQFGEQFSALEEELPSVGKAIQDHDQQTVTQTTDGRDTAITESILVAGGGVLLLAVLGWTITRSVVRPLRRVGAVVTALAEGDLRGTTGITSKDEVGRMATALEESMATMRTVVAAIGDSSTTLASATEELSASAQNMTRLADESSTQSGVVAGAAVQVSTNVQTVAAGSEQMGASIREIAQNASEVSRVAAQAVSVADNTTATVAKLGESSLEIASVVKVITSIAEQTNLLALNATIEAARAGEAGKGFAVVANEVKELAQETAKATEDIARRVEAIQADTEGAVRAISEISSIISVINDSQSTIAAAVEEQTATTTEMNRNVAEAAQSADRIAENIGAVASATGQTTAAMGDAQTAIEEVARMASTLHSSVSRFRY